MNKRERKLSFLLIICVGVLLLAFFAMVILPQYQAMSKKADEATVAKNNAEKALKTAQELKKKEKNITTRLANLKARIPSSLELSNVINRIGERAVQNNLQWLQGTPETTAVATPAAVADPAAVQGDAQAITEAPQLNRHDFSIIVQGSMDDFIQFMADLTDKSIGRIIVINSLDVQFQSGKQLIQATLKLQVIGWDQGADIGSDGCITDTGTPTTNNPNDPACNRTAVTD